jgi:hypothetical protein
MRLCTGKEFAVFGGPLPADRTDPSDPSDQSDSPRAVSEAARPAPRRKAGGNPPAFGGRPEMGMAM